MYIPMFDREYRHGLLGLMLPSHTATWLSRVDNGTCACWSLALQPLGLGGLGGRPTGRGGDFTGVAGVRATALLALRGAAPPLLPFGNAFAFAGPAFDALALDCSCATAATSPRLCAGRLPPWPCSSAGSGGSGSSLPQE